MSNCTLCPRNCNIDRSVRPGFCGVTDEIRIARAAPHYDEEPVISGTRGSGAIFFAGCPLRCAFCQNYDLSHRAAGKPVTKQRLREIIDGLIAQGVHNINFVTPTQYTQAILEVIGDGLPIPVVWNNGGYEKVETLRRLEGRVQVYLPDFKYMDKESARRYSSAPDYFEAASMAIAEMLRQTGSVELDDDGIIRKGTIIRHLILPGHADESCRILNYIAEHFKGAWVSLMAQYLPFGEALNDPDLCRRLTQEEYDQVADHLLDLGLEEGFVQELSSSDECYIPKFDGTGI